MMEQINIHAAKTHLSALVDKAVMGESFIIAKSGRPLVTVSAYSPNQTPVPRVGFLKGKICVPKDFDCMGQQEIADLFEGKQ